MPEPADIAAGLQAYDPNGPTTKPQQPMGERLWRALLDTPSAVASSLWDTVKYPGQLLNGEKQFSYDEAIPQAFNAAGLATTGSMPMAQRGALGSGGGAMVQPSTMRGYHGSPQAGLQELMASERGPLGPGVYLSPYENIAKRYAGDSGAVYQHEVGDVFNGLGSKFMPSDVNPYHVWREQTGRLAAAAEPEHKAAISELAGRMQPDDGYPFFVRLAQALGGTDKAQALFKSAGFKGVSGHVDGPEIAYFGNISGQ